LVNPTAGGGRARRHLAAIEQRAESVGARVEISRSADDFVNRARRAVEEGIERLVVAGGDGTAHMACQALARSSTALGLLPIGRGNDFASSLAVPKRIDAALDLAIEGATRRVDLGRVGDEWFAFYAGVGFDSATSKTANGHPRWWPDRVTYVVAVVRTLFGFHPPMARVEYDGGSFEGAVMFVTACNGPLFGGGMRIAPGALLDDGVLDLVIVRRVGRLELLRIFPSVYSGRHVDHPRVSIHRTTRVRFSFDPETLLGSDGEVIGEVGGEVTEVKIVPRALSVAAGESGR
jgi:diacylglycerol kinase (ATP)